MHKNSAIYAGLGVVFIIAAALNYNALQHFAYEQAQVNYWLSFGVPILVDTFIAIAAYIALINKEQGEDTTMPRRIVKAFTVGSIFLNAMHYPLTLAGLSMAGFIPMVVYWSIELALQQMEIRHRRNDVIDSITKLQSQVQKLRDELAEIEAATVQKTEEQAAIIAAKNAEIEAKAQVLSDTSAQVQAAELQLEQVKIALAQAENCTLDWQSKEANLLRLDGMLAAGVNYSQAARVLDISPNTARNWARNLNGSSISRGQVGQ